MTFLALILVALILRFTPWRHGFPLDLLGGWCRQTLAWSTQRPLWQAWLVWALPLLVVGLLLWAAAGIAYGLFSLILHCLVLLLCVGRADPLDAMTSGFEQAWLRGDREAASLVAERDLQVIADSPEELQRAVSGRVVWEVFQGYLVPIFWYLLLGPLGAMGYRMLRNLQGATGHPMAALAGMLLHALEWLPARLLALSMALVGHFEHTLRELKLLLLDWEVRAEQLTARCAQVASSDAEDLAAHRLLLPATRSLLRRSLMVWAVVVAFVSLLG